MSTYKYSAPPPPAAARLRKPRRPFVAADHKPAEYDGVFRVLLISSGSVASVKIPDIVGALSRVSLLDSLLDRAAFREGDRVCVPRCRM